MENDYSKFTFQELRERLDGLILRIRYDGSRNLPLEQVYAEVAEVILAMDQQMEKYKDTPVYDLYQQERKRIGQFPIWPDSDFSHQ